MATAGTLLARGGATPKDHTPYVELHSFCSEIRFAVQNGHASIFSSFVTPALHVPLVVAVDLNMSECCDIRASSIADVCSVSRACVARSSTTSAAPSRTFYSASQAATRRRRRRRSRLARPMAAPTARWSSSSAPPSPSLSLRLDRPMCSSRPHAERDSERDKIRADCNVLVGLYSVDAQCAEGDIGNHFCRLLRKTD
eukprot:4177743-Pleurochrysis_carterae.AAC.2